ncbi:hypothetical protein [Pseudonocardia sp.]|uniref:hypothetical protein n=1 Tax=Pseudonocardia sp. TaxID=60912 RepID=UPI003D11FCCE
MPIAVRVAAYAGALALLFGLAWIAGGLAGAAAPVPAPVGTAESGTHGHDGGPTPGGGGAVGGLAVTDAGYTLAVAQRSFRAGVPGELALRITGPDGAPVTAFDVEHEKRMHLVLVRRDATGFQHLHPELDPDGTWRTPLTLPVAGVYRVFADFLPTGGPALTLGTDLFVPGEFEPAPSPEPSRTATVDGYEVTLQGDLTGGEATQLVATISRDGDPVTDLEPYLGAFGHLVVLRADDLAYLHVHPDTATAPRPEDRAGPLIAFTAETPSSGTYRLFLDFRHGDTVRTAEFTLVTVTPPTAG